MTSWGRRLYSQKGQTIGEENCEAMRTIHNSLWKKQGFFRQAKVYDSCKETFGNSIPWHLSLSLYL
jgi:hypothetical protein